MMNNKLASYTYAYALWFLSIGIALLAAMILRETVIFSTVAAQFNRYTIHLITQVITILLGLALVIVVVVLENRYRTGLARQRTLSYFARFAGIVLLMMAATHFWYTAVALRLGTLDQFRLMAALGEIVAGVLALRLARRKPQQ